ncbi:MAG: DNA adenine methylase [Pseudomonadota bacterium]
MESNLQPITPATPLAGYMGGKSRLAKIIIKRISSIEHTTYVEPFVGMGGIFLRRPFKAKVEVINDYSQDIHNLFRVVKHHLDALIETIDLIPNSRAEWQRQTRSNPSTLTDIQRAARFLYLQRLSFGGKVTSRSFGVAVSSRSKAFVDERVLELVRMLHKRLRRVVIEALPFEDCLRRYDRVQTLFYLDPPYYGHEHDYGPIFSREDFARLAAILADIKGRFILSINDCEPIRELFAGFEIEPVETVYTAAGYVNPRKPAKELLVSN